MEKLINEFLTDNYTTISHEDTDKFEFNAPHLFIVEPSLKHIQNSEQFENVEIIPPVSVVKFQKGPIKENGVNGVANEDLISMVVKRLQCFQESPYKCDENEQAIKHLEDCLKVLRIRTDKRVDREVEGTSEI